MVSGGPKRDLTVLFSLNNAERGVPQVPNPFIPIILAQLKVVGLRMLSAGQYLAHLLPNLFITRPQIAISEELLAARND